MSVFIGLIVFSIIVVVHELGHFFAARRCGILVEEFAVGMGPKLFSTQRGETVYSLRLFPIGGFCKMLGEDELNTDERAFNSKTVGQRFMVISAGAIVNIILAMVVFVGISFFSITSTPVIDEVVDGSPASEVGLIHGDRITEINGSKVRIFEDVLFPLTVSKGEPMNVVVLRDGSEYEKVITPSLNEDGDYKFGFRPSYKTGLLIDPIEGVQRAGFFESLYTVFWETTFFIKSSVYGIVQLFTLNISLNELSGPIGVVNVIGDQYQETIKVSVSTTVLTMLNLMGILSAAIGIFNLLPLPALDGGRLVFLAIEAIRRKPIDPEKEGMVHFVGLVLLMILAVFVAYSDIMKII